MWLAALKGLASLPDLIKAVERIGDKLDDKAAMERLGDKRERNLAAVKRVLESKAGQRGKANKPPAVRGGNAGGA